MYIFQTNKKDPLTDNSPRPKADQQSNQKILDICFSPYDIISRAKVWPLKTFEFIFLFYSFVI